MLTCLRIKNLALVADVTLELQPGYNAITGETGAGKSILIGALNLVLGERADRGLIRFGANDCAVEATFDLRNFHSPLDDFLRENGLEPCEAGLLILKRTLTNTGANRQFVNGSPATLNALATIGNWLVDIHGPHDHQSLLRPAHQLALLDAFGKLESLRTSFTELARSLADLVTTRTALSSDETSSVRQIELLRYQVGEIDAAHLTLADDEQLPLEYERASNAARLLEVGQAALRQLSDNEDSLLNSAGVLGRSLLELKRLDPGVGELIAAHEQTVAQLGELKTELDRYLERIDLDPARLQQLEERLNVIQSLKRKYGHTVADVIRFGQSAAEVLRSLENRESNLDDLNRECLRLSTQLRHIGQQLGDARRRAAPTLQSLVADELTHLGFRNSRFEIELHSSEDSADGEPRPPALSTGYDQIEFRFAPNPGEPPHPLRAIASSGEMARVMLALKTVLANQDAIPVLIFDEVDANIGGDTAQSVGSKMREIGRHRQVLCITHLAPVAACASHHFLVTKATQLQRTTTRITHLDQDARIVELARMLGGPGDAARRHAEALLEAVQIPPVPAETSVPPGGSSARATD